MRLDVFYSFRFVVIAFANHFTSLPSITLRMICLAVVPFAIDVLAVVLRYSFVLHLPDVLGLCSAL